MSGLVATLIISLIILEVFRFRRNRNWKRKISIPDSPVSFGPRSSWFAIKSEDAGKIAELMNVAELLSCNWKYGLEEAADDAIFFTPPVNGWTLMYGQGIPQGEVSETDELKELLIRLSKAFSEAQFFSTQRNVGLHAWMKARDGRVERAFLYFMESGTILSEGQASESEINLRLPDILTEDMKDAKYYERTDIDWPDEELVFNIASSWSINPMELNSMTLASPSLGYLGYL